MHEYDIGYMGIHMHTSNMLGRLYRDLPVYVVYLYTAFTLVCMYDAILMSLMLLIPVCMCIVQMSPHVLLSISLSVCD